MPIDTFDCIWAFPSPTIFFVFNSIKEMFTGDDRVLRHMLSTFSWIPIHVNSLFSLEFLLSLLTKHLSLSEQRRQQCIGSFLVFFIFFLLELLLL